MSKKLFFLLCLACVAYASHAFAQEDPAKSGEVTFTDAPVQLAPAAENTSTLVLDKSKLFKLGVSLRSSKTCGRGVRLGRRLPLLSHRLWAQKH